MTEKGRLLSVCLSRRKGIPKEPVGQGRLLPEHGLEGDAHAGTGRQVSLLCQASADKVRAQGLAIAPGDFAENLLVGGLRPEDLPLGATFRVGETVLLEVTQIGKECHRGCAIREATGDCVMPREGIFARVVEGGVVRPGDTVRPVHGTTKNARANRNDTTDTT